MFSSAGMIAYWQATSRRPMLGTRFPPSSPHQCTHPTNTIPGQTWLTRSASPRVGKLRQPASSPPSPRRRDVNRGRPPRSRAGRQPTGTRWQTSLGSSRVARPSLPMSRPDASRPRPPARRQAARVDPTAPATALPTVCSTTRAPRRLTRPPSDQPVATKARRHPNGGDGDEAAAVGGVAHDAATATASRSRPAKLTTMTSLRYVSMTTRRRPTPPGRDSPRLSTPMPMTGSPGRTMATKTPRTGASGGRGGGGGRDGGGDAGTVKNPPALTTPPRHRGRPTTSSRSKTPVKPGRVSQIRGRSDLTTSMRTASRGGEGGGAVGAVGGGAGRRRVKQEPAAIRAAATSQFPKATPAGRLLAAHQPGVNDAPRTHDVDGAAVVPSDPAAAAASAASAEPLMKTTRAWNSSASRRRPPAHPSRRLRGLARRRSRLKKAGSTRSATCPAGSRRSGS